MIHSRSIGSLGESELIARIQKILPAVSSELMLGIGDDAAAIRLDDSRLLLATVDMQVEGVHFRRDWATAEQIGKKAMAVNISDIAAMGGTPSFALVSLGMPVATASEFFDNIYRGIAAQASEFNIAIIGGNLAKSSEQIVIDITLLGFIQSTQLLTRAKAKPGDKIFVSGTPGLAAAGLRVLEKYGSSYPNELHSAVDALLQPTPRVMLGRALAESGFVTAMIDISDSLSIDMLHICEASQVGCEIYPDRLSQDKLFSNIAVAVGKTTTELILGSAESYELLFTVRGDVDTKQVLAIAETTGVSCTEIGIIQDEQNGCSFVDTDGKRQKLPKVGWDHFTQNP